MPHWPLVRVLTVLCPVDDEAEGERGGGRKIPGGIPMDMIFRIESELLRSPESG